MADLSCNISPVCCQACVRQTGAAQQQQRQVRTCCQSDEHPSCITCQRVRSTVVADLCSCCCSELCPSAACVPNRRALGR